MTDTTFEAFVQNLGDEFLRQDIDKPSRILVNLSEQELVNLRDRLLVQFGIELSAGVFENSGWSDGALVIRANEELIHLFQVLCYAVLLELQRRTASQQS